MNKEYFNSIVSQPDQSTVYDAMGLTDLVRSYPFFQSAHLLLLYNLKKFASEQYDAQLRASSIVISDRSILFNMITNIHPVASVPITEVTEKEEPAGKPSPVKTVEFQLEEDQPVEMIKESEKINQGPGEGLKTGLLEIDDSAEPGTLESPKSAK